MVIINLKKKKPSWSRPKMSGSNQEMQFSKNKHESTFKFKILTKFNMRKIQHGRTDVKRSRGFNYFMYSGTGV